MKIQKKGLNGEEIACRYLSSLGYSVQAKRFRINTGEIDIIATKGEIIYGIEVKFVNSIDQDYHPLLKMNKKKLNTMYYVMQAFVRDNNQFTSYQQSFSLIIIDSKSKVEFYSDLLL